MSLDHIIDILKFFFLYNYIILDQKNQVGKALVFQEFTKCSQWDPAHFLQFLLQKIHAVNIDSLHTKDVRKKTHSSAFDLMGVLTQSDAGAL